MKIKFWAINIYKFFLSNFRPVMKKIVLAAKIKMVSHSQTKLITCHFITTRAGQNYIIIFY